MNSIEPLTAAGKDERLIHSWSKDPTSHLCELVTKDTPAQPLSPSFGTSSSSSAIFTIDGPAADGADTMRPSMELCPAHPGPEATIMLDLKYNVSLDSSPKAGTQGPEKGSQEDDDEDEIEGDLRGCVFFSTNGSAYLLNGSDVQDGGLSLGLSNQQFLPKGDPSVSAAGDPHSTSDLATPPAPVTSFHIASTYQGFISNQIFQNTSSGAGTQPTFHSYHVTNVQHQNTENYLREHTTAKKREKSKENLEGLEEEEDGNVEENLVGTSKTTWARPLHKGGQPLIWICLICKRSFRCGSRLAVHATTLHGADLAGEVQAILAAGETSAFLQNLRQGKGTLISFLEPKMDCGSPPSSNPAPELPDHTENLSNVATGMFSGTVNVTPTAGKVTMEEGGVSVTRDLSPSFTPSLFLSMSAEGIQPGLQCSLPPMEDQEGECQKPLTNTDPTSLRHLSPALFPNTALDPSLDLTPWSPKALCDPTEAKDLVVDPEEDEEELGWCLAEDAEDQEMKVEQETKECASPATFGGPHDIQRLLANQSLCGCPGLPMLANSCPKEDCNVHLTAQDVHSGEAEDQSNKNTSVEEHDEHVTAYSPPMAERTSVPTPGFSILTNDEYSPNSGPSPFQSMSLSNHMSLLHSRNSCKTLKCPKCNWHYKYQQTLDVHMKEKHPESNSHCVYCNLGQQHPRLARGESYNCGYKPYRCEACNYSTTTKGNLSIHMQSDKHLANLQAFQNPGSATMPATSSGVSGSTSTPGGSNFGGRSASPLEPSLPSPQDKQPKQKASWHCKVCNYETNISRNLRIHMTSEKHMQNMLLVHQGLPMGLSGLMQPGPDLCQYYSPQTLRQDQSVDHHLLLNGFQLSTAANRQLSTGFPASSSMSPDTRVTLGQGHGISTTSTPTQEAASLPADDPTLKVFRCLVCYSFTTDNLELLLYHASLTRSLPEHDWKEVAGDIHRCKLCSYGTQLKANFQLHLKTDKHSQKYQLVAHLREGGVPAASASAAATELQLGSFNQAPPLHLRCNLCDFESNSKEKMRLHARGGGHGENFQVYKFLMDLEDSCGASDTSIYCCRLCNHESNSKLGLLQHLHSAAHRESHAQWERSQLQAGRMAEEGLAALEKFINVIEAGNREPGKAVTSLPDPLPAEKEEQTQGPATDAEEDHNSGNTSPTTGQTTVFCCPYCSFVSPAAEQVRSHTVSQHAVQPKFCCPLCQEQLMGRPNLRFHLTHIHNVVSECVERLLLVASTVEPTFSTKVLPSPNLAKPRGSPDTSTSFQAPDGPKDPEEGSTEHTSEKKSDVGLDAEKEQAQDSIEPEDPNDGEKEELEKGVGGILPCPLCRQKAESFPELREHMENEHPELSSTEVQQLCGPGVPSEEEEEEEEEMEEVDESLGVSSSPPGVMAAEGKQMSVDLEPITTATPSVAHDPRQPVSYRKSTNFALDKFLDPSRPYKCTVCKESFTQKNILLVHYNSVSHLHKMKKASIDPSLPSRTEVTTAQDKPFKCTVCRVSYNQSSTLEIHMRSVLHQTRSRVAKLEAAGHSTPDPNNNSGTSAEKSENTGSKNNPVRSISPKIDSAVAEAKVDGPSTEPVRKGLTMPSLPFVSPQMHLSLDLHRQASLLQSPLFTPPLLPPFPLGPETLMKLQQHQQQLLLPFYLHDLKVNPELGIQGGSSFFSLPGAGSMLIGSGGLIKPPNVTKDEPHRSLEPPSSSISLSSSSLACPIQADNNPVNSDLLEQPSECDTKENSARTEEPALAKEEASVYEKEASSLQLPSDKDTKESDKEQATNAMPPPRIPSDVSRTASKALLENFGFELVIQYNEGKQHLLPAHPPLCQVQPAPPRPPRGAGEEHGREKLKCETCGKLFSNMLILKTHEEHVHRRFLPFEALSRYAAQFRKSYDSMYAPKQPVDVQPSEDSHQTSQLSKETPVQIPQLPIPLDFSLCSSFLMPPLSLQAVPSALPSMDELMAVAPTQVQTGEAVAEPDACENRSPRTRITPEQLKVLWNYFDINNLPSEEKILQMSEHTGLAAKVVKHWFRNRLFKERQQDKDSPYNFSTPPSAVMLPESEEPDTQQAPGTELGRPDRWGSRRFSRTKFSDFQFQALQSFFETSAYPKDSEVEKLSQLLGLANRVVVVWFQNARQKARKNAADSPFHTSEKAKELGTGDRCAMSGSKQSTCKKCHLAFPCIFKLIQHLKKCYNDQLAEEDEEQCTTSHEAVEQMSSELQDQPSAVIHPPPEIPEVQESQKDMDSPVPIPNDQEEKPIDQEVGEVPKSESAEQVQEGKAEQPPAMETSSDQPLQEPEKEVVVTKQIEEPQPTEQISTSPPPPQPIIPEPPQSDESTNVYSCDQCHVSFASPELLGKHQSLHILASTQLPGPLLDMPLLMFDHNSSLLPSPLMPSNFNTLPSSLGDAMAAACRKRKLDEDSLSPTESEAGYLGDEPPKDKRLRTTILPEQLEILHRWYMQDSNPTRKMLDRISEEVSLKKRVVQVWFQNTRARERKGQFRCVAPVTSPKPYAKFIPLGKPENLPRAVADAPVGPFLAHRSPSLQVLRETAAFYYNATGIHHATAPAAPPRGNPSPCQPAPTSQAFIKAEAYYASREPATPDPTPAEPADSAAVGTQEAADKQSGVDEFVPVLATDTEERNQQDSPAPNATDEARSPGDLSDSSSLADPESPNPSSHRYTDGGLDALGQRRFRTQMSSLQLKIMKACYANYRTPTMSECELLGSEIGLQKRVIQVWFQNARAKEKKAKLQGLPPPMGLDTSGDTPRAECTYCHIKYDFYVSCRSHVFSRQHIARLREVIQKQLKNEIKYYDLAPAAGSSVPQTKTEGKSGTGIPTGPPAALNYPPPPLGFQNVSASLPRLAPVLLSGQGPTAPIGGLAPFNPGSASNLLGVAASIAPAVLPVPSHPGLPKTSTDQAPACEFRSDPHTEKENRPSISPQLSTPQKALPDTTVLSGITASKNMKNLQAAIAGGGGASPLLGSQFLPFPLPGAPPMFSPQVQGAYFQQLYGMKKGIFPMNPVIPQTIIGLLPNSVVRPEVPKPPEPAPPVEAEEAARSSGEDLLLLQSAGVSTVDVAHKFLCRRCRVAFDDEAQAVAHQDETCFHRESAPPPQRVPVCTYHCLACQVLVSGTEALGQHIRSAAHKRQALRNNNPTFAKEEANIPHADPSPNPASTSVLLAL